MKRRILSALLALCLLLALAPQGLAAGADSGSCGGGVRWAYDGAGTLTISGTGAMPDYDHEWEENPAPWWNYRTEITTVRVESGITRVGQEAFGGGPYRAGYPQLSSVTLAATVREIGAWAFSDAGQLTNITLPAALETIENGAFAYSGLQSVTLPVGLAQLDESAFNNCWDLEAVSVASGNSRYLSDGGVLYETTVGNEKNLLLYPVQKSDAGYRVLDGTVRLAQEAFAYNESITAIQLPQGIRDIPDFAFLLCLNLKSVNLPDGLTRVSPSAFWGCQQITRLDIPASVTDFSSGYGPAEDWIGIETQPLAVYFYSSTAPEFNEGIVATRVYEEAPVTIYYPTGATGWDQVMEQEYLQQCMEMGLLSFATWTPGQTPVQPQPDQYARIVRLDPANGAQDVGYDAGNKPSFTLTFDREILAMDTPNGYVFPEVDFDRGTLRICRADTDEVVYEVSYDAYMNDLYPITGTTSSDLAVEGACPCAWTPSTPTPCSGRPPTITSPWTRGLSALPTGR